MFTKRNNFLAAYGLTLFALLMIASLIGSPARFVANADVSVEPKPVYYEEPLFFPLNTSLLTTMVPGDFNNDGWQDVFAYSSSSNMIVTLLNDQAGGYLLPINKSLALGATNNSLRPILLDFNRDNNLDVAIYIQGNIKLLLGNGAGNFDLAQSLPVDSDCFEYYIICSATTGDFNGDSYSDLLAVSPSKVSLLPGKQDGTFNSSTVISLPFTPVGNLVDVLDFNRDNKLDFVVASANAMFLVAGNGDGTFQAAEGYSAEVNATPNEVVLSDFTGDNNIDIVLVQKSTSSTNRGYTYIVYIGSNNGTFTKGQNYAFPFVWSSQDFSTHVKFDVNNDGKLDIVVGEVWGNIHFLLNQDNGNFQINTVKPFMGIGRLLYAVDFNKDGRNDLLTGGGVSLQSTGLQIALNKGAGEFAVPSVLMNRTFPKVADFNSDGNQDIMGIEGYYSNPYNSYMHLYLKSGQGNGLFNDSLPYTLSQNSGYISPSTGDNIKLTDLNQDTKPDLVFNGSYSLTTLINTGAGFSQPITMGFPSNNKYSLEKIDNDNLPDLIATIEGLSKITLYIFKGNGDGYFQNPISIEIQKSGQNTNYYHFVTGDFDGNNKTDIVLIITNTVWLLSGNNDGTFQNPILIRTANSDILKTAVGDFNNDNILDLITVRLEYNGNNNSKAVIEMTRGKNDGSFYPTEIISQVGSYFISNLKIVDMNSDGNLDILISLDGRLHIYYGYGNATFTAGQIGQVMAGYSSVGSLEVYDFNKDNVLDVVQADGYAVNTFMLLSKTPPPIANLKFAVTYNSYLVGAPISLTLKALDTLLRPTPGYTGTVRLEVSGGGIAAANYTYTYADRGSHVFTYTFPTAGQYIITATDTLNPALVATTTVNVGEPLPEIIVTNASVAEGNIGTTSLVFTATLNKVSTQTVTAQYATGGGTATVGTDYLSASGVLTFSPGITRQLVTVTVQGDTNFEPDETFNLTLSNPQNATIVIAPAIGTILNDDAYCNPFVVTSATDANVCGTLRFAITSANTFTGGVTISVVPTVTEITLSSALPTLSNQNSQPITLTAPCITQSGRGVPGVRLSSSNVVTIGLQIGSKVRVDGFKVTNFSEYGVRITGNNNTLDCMWLGTADGATTASNGGGIIIEGSNNVLGSSNDPALANLVSGNNGVGVRVKAGASNNQLNGVLIGYGAGGQLLRNTGAALVVENGGSLKIARNSRIAA